MDIRTIAVKANIDRAIETIKEAANGGAFSVDLNANPLPTEDYQPITLKEEMYEEIQSAFSNKLEFDGDVVKWS